LGFIFRPCGVLVVRLIPQDSPALHLIVFDRPARNTVFQQPVKGVSTLEDVPGRQYGFGKNTLERNGGFLIRLSFLRYTLLKPTG